MQGEISSMHCTIQDSNEEKQDAFDVPKNMLTKGSLSAVCE